MLLCGLSAYAQSNDPVVMTINEKPVLRSEFEYSYNKNNTDGVIDKKTVEQYVDLFVNYKLKVEAAEAARIDTAKAFRQEFATYRDQQIRPAMITDADVEAEAMRMYREAQHRVDSMGGLVKPAHILIMMRQKATKQQEEAARLRADSIYNVLLKGGDFATLAKTFSQDPGSARNGGELPWLERGQTLKEFDDAIFSMKKGELRKPVLSPAGYHIILLKDKRSFFPYDSLRTNIMQFIEQRGIREQIINQKITEVAKATETTAEEVLAKKREEMVAKDPSLRYLIKEYHDGLLLYEVTNREVWGKAANDNAALANYFARNKKKYKWEEPRFKGIAYHTRVAADVKAVKKAVKSVDFEKWADVLRTTFNNDSTLRIRVEKGIFKQGDNAMVDKEVFKKDTTVAAMKDFPYAAVYGKKLKAPKVFDDVRGQVVADYQDELEKRWVEALRKRYPVVIDREVLKTVNKH